MNFFKGYLIQKWSGLTLLDFVFLTFLHLKLSGEISWSWWFVCMPLYSPVIIIPIISYIVAFISLYKKQIKNIPITGRGPKPG